MKYRNERTGAVIETAAVVSGGDWKPVAEPDPEPVNAPEPDPEPAPKKTSKKSK